MFNLNYFQLIFSKSIYSYYQIYSSSIGNRLPLELNSLEFFQNLNNLRNWDQRQIPIIKVGEIPRNLEWELYDKSSVECIVII